MDKNEMMKARLEALEKLNNPLIKKMRERVEKMKAEGKTVKSFSAPNTRFAELIKTMKEAKLNKIEKKED